MSLEFAFTTAERYLRSVAEYREALRLEAEAFGESPTEDNHTGRTADLFKRYHRLVEESGAEPMTWGIWSASYGGGLAAMTATLFTPAFFLAPVVFFGSILAGGAASEERRKELEKKAEEASSIYRVLRSRALRQRNEDPDSKHYIDIDDWYRSTAEQASELTRRHDESELLKNADRSTFRSAFKQLSPGVRRKIQRPYDPVSGTAFIAEMFNSDRRATGEAERLLELRGDLLSEDGP